jgi:hypothetical protein
MTKTRQQSKHKLAQQHKDTKAMDNKRKFVSRYCRILYQIILHIGLAFTMYTFLWPSVKVEYSSEIIPQNESALPLKVTNNCYYPIRDIRANLSMFYNWIQPSALDSVTAVDREVERSLPAKESTSFIDERTTSWHRTPKDGHVDVKITYYLPVIPIKCYASKRFILYFNKDNSIRWLTKETPSRLP